ncbi:MAG: hypothetical protein NVS9B10_29140 [Nevskia sp.]
MSLEMDATDAIIDRIRGTSDVKEKAEIAGLSRKPFTGGDIDQACQTCIYFLPRHGHCDQPQLNFPVDPDWWCRLWRV